MNTATMHLLRGAAAPTAAQLISAAGANLAALESNPFLRGDGVHAIIPDDGNHADSTIRAWLRGGDGQPLVEPIEVSVNSKDATAIAPNGLCKVEMTLTGADFATFIVTPGADGVIELKVTTPGPITTTTPLGVTTYTPVTYTVAIRHPYMALPVASRVIA